MHSYVSEKVTKNSCALITDITQSSSFSGLTFISAGWVANLYNISLKYWDYRPKLTVKVKIYMSSVEHNAEPNLIINFDSQNLPDGSAAPN